jgi:hypothetical protein
MLEQASDGIRKASRLFEMGLCDPDVDSTEIEIESGTNFKIGRNMSWTQVLDKPARQTLYAQLTETQC